MFGTKNWNFLSSHLAVKFALELCVQHANLRARLLYIYVYHNNSHYRYVQTNKQTNFNIPYCTQYVPIGIGIQVKRKNSLHPCSIRIIDVPVRA